MENINSRILRESDFVGECYKAQTLAFSPLEYDLIASLVSNHGFIKMLDVGTGNGMFISGLANILPNLQIKAIDADPRLTESAAENYPQKNVTFVNALFDGNFPDEEYDLIHARFSVEHMPDVPCFIAEAYRRLKEGGLLLITEYFVAGDYSGNETWKLFRTKELELYQKFGSHPRISALLPGLYRDAGFINIDSMFRHVCPPTVGCSPFYELVRSYARLYNHLEPGIFDDQTRDQILSYAEQKIQEGKGDDSLLISHTIGVKPLL
jgi:ubiquinone/menaquinone biosynthesis C-methylase UbiE